jgi:hypothetical protein
LEVTISILSNHGGGLDSKVAHLRVLEAGPPGARQPAGQVVRAGVMMMMMMMMMMVVVIRIC